MLGQIYEIIFKQTKNFEKIFFSIHFRKMKQNFFICSFSGAENEPRDIHLSQALPYMEGM